MATNQEKLNTVELRVSRYLDLPISKVAERVLQATIKRGGKNVSVIQEIADGKTLGQENKAAIAALTSLVGQLVKGQTVDYERIKQDTRDVLAQETVSVEVTVNEKEAA